jgi:putative ABC transport system substrate-binding protein
MTFRSKHTAGRAEISDPVGVEEVRMRRREFIVLIGSATVLGPLVAHAQQSALPVVGFLGTETPELFANRLRAFSKGLSETGYVEGENVAVEYRWAEGQNSRLPALASDLVRREVSVIVANGPAAVAAKVITTTIPIIFSVGATQSSVGSSSA